MKECFDSKLITNGESGLYRKSSYQGNSAQKVPIIMRNMVPEIPSTTYGTFSIYKYPAKFIPQVVAFALKKYAMPGMKVFDPFAGYGTTGLVSRVYKLDYELWDLNPIIDIIHDTAISTPSEVNIKELIDKVARSDEEFIPDWSNLHYWFPDEFIPLLSKSWGTAHSLSNELKRIILLPLIKVTNFFSYGDEKVHKLYKSRFSIKKISQLLEKDWSRLFYDMLEREIVKLLKKIEEYQRLAPSDVNYTIRSGIDIVEAHMDSEADIMITSPPYLQAQEYIRSSKLELFWLGYKEKAIKELSRKEIPYRNVEAIEINSERYHAYRKRITIEKLRTLYDRYFYAILNAFATIGESITDRMCIFVGPAKIRTTSIPIDDIIIEHLSEFGWKHEVTYIDTIVSRVMFKSDVNPASGFKDSRMKTEHLVILKRRK